MNKVLEFLWSWRGMNLLQIPLDIQLVSTFQSLSVANAARFSRSKDTQFPSHTTIFSSKKYQTSLQPTSLRRAWGPEDSKHVPNGIKYSVQSISVISSGCPHPFLSYTPSSPARRLQVPVSNSTGIYSCHHGSSGLLVWIKCMIYSCLQ